MNEGLVLEAWDSMVGGTIRCDILKSQPTKNSLHGPSPSKVGYGKWLVIHADETASKQSAIQEN